MYELDATTIFVSFVITWSIGLLPPLIIRYAILKHPIAMWPAIGTCALFWVINIVLFTAMGSQNKAHFALVLIAFMSYWILRQGTATKNEQEQKTASVSAVKPAIRNSSLNEGFSGGKERVSMELSSERHGNDENKNPVSRIDRTHDKSYEIAWDEIESGNKDKAVWARAFSLADGAEDKAKAIYISLRVSMLGEGKKSTEHKPANPTKGVSVNWRDLEPGDKVIAIIVFAAISFSIIFLLLSS